ncbi:bifunctional phosphoribosylaminoimidazolecarboxamide formyltransferase/IMP cyclohydrolase [Candidatus Endowatersipora endosymbiont of Watersipora subatra]|uniref:bifunctional phosphoribosylaminoimidazolecarboxamide formyltransferase/IMP cyclohydrolase n=1 Tax=Candidatus Endowatersipora endosymbiont of Watersipora subatra TaxID=3077946 RepID=UPI00312CBBD6
MSIAVRSLPVPDLCQVKRALLSVFDKTNLFTLVEVLGRHNVELLSTGGTFHTLKEMGYGVTHLSDITQCPEMMDGRIKTLHPAVHGGLLAIRNNDDHQKEMNEHGIEGIDLLVSNFYPFEDICHTGAEEAEIIENIDIGGPAMVRASAKNYPYVCIVTSINQYREIIDEINTYAGKTRLSTRKKLAQSAFSYTASYDAAVSNWMAKKLDIITPDYHTVGGRLIQIPRYGENPHQCAALYDSGEKRPGVVQSEQIQGKKLSFNNINDTDAAFELVSEFDPNKGPVVAIIKHANPCGVARHPTLKGAYQQALSCDPISAFGGVISMNTTLDGSTAQAILGILTEVIIAPDADNEALNLLKKKKNIRLLLTHGLANPMKMGFNIRSVAGGYLIQNRDTGHLKINELNVVTKRGPTDSEIADMLFAFVVAKHVQSNAIVYVKDGTTVGIGAGQMSRLDSARIATLKAKEAAKIAGWNKVKTIGSVVASDAFFPFSDALLLMVEAGITAVIQPGGSVRDDEIIEAADSAGLAMVFTGIRHFRH